MPLLRRVIVAFGDEIVMRDTLREALIEIFGEAPETLEDACPDPATRRPRRDGKTPPDEEPSTRPAGGGLLLAQAEDLFTQADLAPRRGRARGGTSA